MSKLTIILHTLLYSALLLGFAAASQAENLALGKKYTFSKQPNYQPCTDPGDDTQLTDGILRWTPKTGQPDKVYNTHR